MGVISNNKLYQHIGHIALCLKKNQASAMVGAGYSFNAKKVDHTVSNYSDWQQLGRYFFEKLMTGVKLLMVTSF